MLFVTTVHEKVNSKGQLTVDIDFHSIKKIILKSMGAVNFGCQHSSKSYFVLNRIKKLMQV